MSAGKQTAERNEPACPASPRDGAVGRLEIASSMGTEYRGQRARRRTGRVLMYNIHGYILNVTEGTCTQLRRHLPPGASAAEPCSKDSR